MIIAKEGNTTPKVVYSKEELRTPHEILQSPSGKPIPGSISFVPSVMGLILAGEVVKDLIRGGTL